MEVEGLIWERYGTKCAFVQRQVLNDPRVKKQEMARYMIPSKVAGPWDLSMGDRVSLWLDDSVELDWRKPSAAKILNSARILSRNGVFEPIPRLDFDLDLVGGLRLAHPQEEFPISVTGERTMQIARVIAPFGKGGLLIILGPSDTGKTWTSRFLVEALFTIAKDPSLEVLQKENTLFVFLALGERVADVRRSVRKVATIDGYVSKPWEDVLKHPEKYADVPHEIYHAFRGVNGIKNVRMAIGRARTSVCEGRDVIFVIDSLWGAGTLLSQALGAEGGFAATGVSRNALNYIKDEMLFAGNVPGGGSLTLILTALDEGPKTASRTILEEIGPPKATLLWASRDNPAGTPFPWFDMQVTTSREIEGFLPPARLAFHEQAKERLAVLNFGLQLKRLQAWFDAVEGWDPEAITGYWEECDREQEKRGRSSYYNDVVHAGASLRKVVDRPRAVLDMLESAGLQSGRFLAELLECVPADVRNQFFSQAQKGVLGGVDPRVLIPRLKEDEAAEFLVHIAEQIRGRGARESLLRAWSACGLDSAELGSNDGVSEMMLISRALETVTGRGFSRSIAREMVEAGCEPLEVFEKLLEGARPCDLYE